MNGTFKAFAAAGVTVVLAAVSGAYGYGSLAGEVHRNVDAILVGDARNARAIAKNEAKIERWEQLSRTALSNLARDSAVAATKIENIENGIAQMLSEIRKRQ